MASMGVTSKKRLPIEITESVERRIVERLKSDNAGKIADIARAFNCPVAQIQEVNDKHKIRRTFKKD